MRQRQTSGNTPTRSLNQETFAQRRTNADAPHAPRAHVRARSPRRSPLVRAAREVVTCLFIFLLAGQQSFALAGSLAVPRQRAGRASTTGVALPGAGLGVAFASVFDSLSSLFGSGEAPAPAAAAQPVEPVALPTPTPDAAISRHAPSLNGGRIEGHLRVNSGENVSLNSQFQLTGDLYTVGTPNVIVNSGASHGGIVDDGGASTPSGYPVTLNGGFVMPGKIHKRANALPLPSMPTVPAASGTRTVNINTAADVNNIGAWSTVKDLNVSPSNLVINVPPGNYGTFSVNGASRLNFTAGAYNFSGTINLNAGSTVQTTGAVVINIAQNFNLNGGFVTGTNTQPGDVLVNILGGSCSFNNASSITGSVRAPNANVNFNGTGTVTGQVIANYLNMNGGKIVGDNAVTPPPDTTQPSVSITAPANNSATTSASVTVTGAAADPGANASGIASVTVNNVAAAYNAATGQWSLANVALNLGANTITARATDVAGNQTTTSVNVTRQQPPDTQAPAVAITSPANNSTTTSSSITVSGTVSDTGANASGVSRVMVNGAQAAVTGGNWTISGVALNLGANTITATAFDNANNQGTASVVVNRQQTPDTTAPVVSITSPANNSTTQAETITVSGAASDPGSPSSGISQVTVNGMPAAYVVSDGTWTVSGVALTVGANTITARAYDNANNQTTATINVTRQPPADTQAPQVSISTPADNSTTTEATVNVSGTASDSGQYQSGVTSVTVNGVNASYDAATGQWIASNVPVNLDANTITATATDGAGNHAEATVHVTRQVPPDTQAPELAIDAPADGSSTYEETVTVSGTVSDAGSNASGVAQVTVNGMPAAVSSGTWTISGVSLSMGDNTITVRAYDNANNQTTKTVTVTRVLPPDTAPPSLSVTEPSDNSTTDAETTNVSGTVSDTGANASGVAGVTVNGVAAQLNSQNGAWTLSGVALSLGPNTLNVRATDRAGNEVARVVRVTRVLPPDTQAPSLTITSPADNTTVPDETVTVTGTANDTGVNAAGVRTVTVNGVNASYDATTHVWSATVTLAEGQNEIVVVATDDAPASNSSEARVNVRRFTPDRDAPVVTVTSPFGSSETYDETVTVAGTATDDGLNATGVQTVKVNGRAASYDATTRQWSLADVELAYGENVIVVVATDGASPAHEGRAEARVTRLRIPPPTLNVNNPQNGGVYSAGTITVAGSVSSISKGALTVKVNGSPATVNGGTFAKTVTLDDGPNTITVVASDAQAQETQVSLSVLRDQAGPAVSFVNVPATVQPGGAYQIKVDAADNVGVAEVEFSVGGVRVGADAEAPYEFTLDVPSPLTAGNVITLTAVARDLSGATAVATAQTRTSGPGGISGYVFDDVTGYVLEGASASLGSGVPTATDAEGAYSIVSSVPTGVVRLSKAGYTPVERIYTVSPGEGTALFDARLTPLDSHANQLTPSGGTATGDGGRLQLTFGAGSIPADTDVRVTSVSPQGLENLLPFGWSPVPGAAVDVRASSVISFNAAARLRVTQTPFPPAGHSVALAYYDEQTHGWTVAATGINSGAGGELEADIAKPGQYAFVVADTGATAPPAPSAGSALTSSRSADPSALDAAQATAVSTPRVAAYSSEARASISFVADAPTQLPSGVSIEATLDETYNFLGGKDQLLVGRPAQDFVLYSFPGASAERQNRLGAFFIAKPTRTEFAVSELLSANVHVEVRSGRASRVGALVGQQGGAVTSTGGARLNVPANALDNPQPIFFGEVDAQQANVTLPEGYEIVGAFDVDLAGATLSRAGSISLPSFSGDASRVVVARLLNVGGLRAPKVVARAVAEDGRLVSTTSAPSGVTLSGVSAGGRYVFVRVPVAFGYAAGRVTDAGQPASLVKVSTDKTPFIDVTAADGRYLLLASAEAPGANQLGAASTATDATGRTSVTLNAQDSVASSDITLASVALSVESVTPADGAQNTVATTPVTVSFNKPVAAQTVTSSNFKLANAAGNPVLGQIAVLAGGRVAVFTPSNTLAGSTAYRVSVAQGVRDIYGKPLAAAFSSTFTTASVVRTDDRLKPEKIRIDYPDANGLSRIHVPAGAVPEGSVVIAVNETSGSTVSAVAFTSGLEMAITAQVGDQITLIVRQPDGVEYKVSQAAYRRADGVTSVGAHGGTITSDDGGLVLAVPEGAIVGQADIRLSPRTEAQIRPTLPRTGDMSPDKVPYGGGVQIQSQGQFHQTKELHVEIPVPAGVQVEEGQRVVMLRPSKYMTADGVEHDVWETVTSATVEGGKYKSTSPPFSGLWLVPDFPEIEVFIPKFVHGVYGTVKEQAPGFAPKPLKGVTVKIINGAQPADVPVIVTHTSDNGGFGTFDFRTAIGTEHIVYAEDASGRNITAIAAPDLKTNPWLYPGMFGITGYYAALEFPPADASGPDSKPAVLRMFGQRLDLDPGQRDSLAEDGIASVGTQVAVVVDIFPRVATFSGKLLANGTEVQTLVWQTESGGESNPDGERRVTTFRVPSQGSFSVSVETLTKHNAPATKSKATYNFVGLSNPNVRPPLPGPPKVLSVTPPDKAKQVDAGRRIRFEFSEPVKNLVAGETVYVQQVGSDKLQGGRLLSGGVPIGANSENISQLDFEPEGGLAGGKDYKVHVTSDVTDTDGHKLDQEQTSEDDDSPQPFESMFTTFAGLVLTGSPVTNNGHRIAAAGQYAITVDGSRGSHMTVYDMSNPSKPEVAGTAFVPDWAVGLAMVEVPEGGETFKVGNPKKEYSRIAVVGSVPIPADFERTTNLWIYSLEDPAKPELIGVSSLSFGSNLTAIPANLTILGKRAYVGATPQGGTYAVDIEQAINQWAEQIRISGPAVTGSHPMVTAVKPHGGFAKDAKRQTVTYGAALSLSNQGSAPTNAISAISQVTVAPSAGGLRQTPVAYVTTPNKPYLATLGFHESDDSRNGFWDDNNDGRDDRVLELWELEPVGMTRDVKALSGIPIKGRMMDVAVVLGYDRLWIFDATDPRDLKQYPSRTFKDLGIGDLGYAMRMDVEGSLAYIIFQNHIAVVDFSDPEHPARIATIESAGAGLKSVAVKDGFIYTLSDEGISVSIARPASQVIVHGINPGDDRICTNPVVLSRSNRMTQAAGVYFQVFGSDMPESAEVIIRRERNVGEQHNEETLATLHADIDANLSSAKVIVGRAKWNSETVIDRTWTYTAEVVFDSGADTEFHARREPIPFSYLIAEAMTSFGSSGGKGFYNYVLGGEANVTLTVDGHNILDDAADPHPRTYGLNADLVKHDLEDGVYPFKLRAVLESDPSVTDEVEGEMVVANTPPDLRLPGNTVVSDVELQSGNLAVSYTDAYVSGRGLPLSLSRSYNGAGSNSFGPFGYGWTHNFQVLLVHDRLGKSYTMRGGDGGGQVFKEDKLSGGKIEAEDPHVGTLVKNSDGSFDYFTRAHVKYHFPGAMEEDDTNYFNLAYMGNLQYVEDPNGNRTTLNYDTQGRMTKVTDSSNRTLDFTYEQAETPLVGVIAPSAGAISCTNKGQFGLVRARFLRSDVGKAWRVSEVKGPGGLKLTYEYDDDGNLTRAERSGEDALSTPSADYVWQYEYNPPSNDGKQYPHLIRTITAPNDTAGSRRVTTYDYHFDQFRKPVKKIGFPGGVSNTFEYTFTSNRVTQAVVADGRGNPTTYAFDRESRTVTATRPRGASTATVYDKKGQPSSVTDPLGTVTKTTYERGNPTSVTVSGGGASATTTARYDTTFNKLISSTDPNGNTTTYSLDSRGNVTQVTLPTGGVIRNAYASNGDVSSTTDQYGSTTSYSYDQWGNRTRAERGAVTSSHAFDIRGRMTSSSGTLEPSVQYTYDALDRRIKTVATDPSGIRDATTATRTYMPEGQALTVTSVSGGQRISVTNTYDEQDRMTHAVEDVSGAGTFTLDYTYDENSNLLTQTDRRGVKSTHVYDELNFRTKTTVSGPFGASKTVADSSVNLVGLPVTTTDVYGQTVSFEYDGMQRLKKRTLPGGHVEEMSYDAAGNVTRSKDPNGRATTTSYDGLNRPVERRDAAGRTTTWVYDDSSRTVTEQRDPQGLTVTTRSDSEGRVVSRSVKFSGGDYTTGYEYTGLTVRVTDPRGVVTTKHLSAMGDEGDVSVEGADPSYSTSARFNGFGGVKSRTDAMGRATTVTLDGFNRPVQVSLPGGASESFTYDGEGNTLSRTDRRGVKTETAYDNLERPVSTKVSGNGDTFDVSAIDYADSASTETHTDARGKETVLKYDGLRRLVSATGADNNKRTMEYDGVNLLRESDGKGKFTSYAYDSANRVTEVTDRDGRVTSVSHSDGGGYTKTVTDRRGVQTVESYDALGRLKSVSRANELVYSFEYDAGSNLKARVDGRSNRTAYTYDALGRVRTIDHASTQTETFEYDAAGNVLEYSDGAGGAVTSTYDAFDHPLTRRNGAGETTSFKYDAEGLLLERTDPKGGGSRTTYAYNALGSLVKVTDAAGAWELTYDPAQNLKTVKDALGRTVSYDYDPVNRVTDVRQPLGLTTHMDYDANGNVTSKTDPKGQQTTISYDALDRPHTISFAGATTAGPSKLEYSYDAEGNVTDVSETLPAGLRRHARTYDPRGRLQTSTDPFGRKVSFEYDAADNLRTLTDASNRQTFYDYDAANRLKTVALPGGGQVSYTWRADGLVSTVDYGAGMRREYAYDGADRLTNVVNTLGAAQTEEYAYTYDANSNRASETKKFNGSVFRTVSYGYDALDRLKHVESSAPGQPTAYTLDYEYDAAGNRKSQAGRDAGGADANHSYTYDDLNRLKKVTGYAGGDIDYGYDGNGNLTSKTQGGQTTAYEYDVRDQLRRVLSGGAEVASYDYDADKRRIGRKVAGSGTLNYVYAGGNVIGEFDESNRLVNRYDYGADILRGELAGEGQRYYFSDGQGSVTALAAAGGQTPAARYEYDAWGERVASGASTNLVGYTGQRLDPETGLVAAGAGERYYAPGLGRFIQQDAWTGTAEMAQSMNRYAYGYNNPLRYTDPSGNKPVEAPGGNGNNILQYRGSFRDIGRGNDGQVKDGAYKVTYRKNAAGQPEMVQQARLTATSYEELIEQAENGGSAIPSGIRGDMKRAAYEAGMAGVNDKNWWSRFWQNWRARTFYDLWNVTSFGLLEENDTLVSDFYAGRITEQQYYEGRAKIGFKAALNVASLGAGAVTGRVVSAVGARFAVATTLAGRTAIGAGVAMTERFAFESAEIGLGLRTEYSGASSYAFSGALGGTLGALSPVLSRPVGSFFSKNVRGDALMSELASPNGMGKIEAPRTEGLGSSSTMDELLRTGGIPGRQGVILNQRTVKYSDMWELSNKTGVEYALTREGGKFVLRSGAQDMVAIPFGVRPIAHTHPPDALGRFSNLPSRADINTMNGIWSLNPNGPRPRSSIIWGPESGQTTQFGATGITPLPAKYK